MIPHLKSKRIKIESVTVSSIIDRANQIIICLVMDKRKD